MGYEQPDFSHFRSMDIWQSASDYDEFLNSGWIGRYIEGEHPNWPTTYPNENYPRSNRSDDSIKLKALITSRFSAGFWRLS